MTEQNQTQQVQQEVVNSLPTPAKKNEMTLEEKLRYAASIGIPLTGLFEAMHGGGPGFLLGLLATGGAFYFGEELKDFKEKHFPKRASKPSHKLIDADWWLGNQSHENVLPDDLFDFDGGDEGIDLSSQKNNGIFCFSELLASGFRPTINRIFVGRTMEGKDVFVSASDLCHVALAGKTGGGKGSLERLIMVQLCYIGARVLLLNPHYMRWVVADAGKEFDEDWTPFEGLNPRKSNRPYLEVPPIDCADFDPISQYLAGAVKEELQKRKREGHEGGKKFKPFFIVIDEWPSIVAEVKDASSNLGKILREGRKFGIFIILTSQDFQVKTLGMEGGSIRNCFLTVFYTGGDKTTAKELLHYENVKDIPENSLGKGIVLIRCAGTHNEPVLVRVPFVDNESVYKLLGPSTFKKAATASPQRHEVEIVEPQVDWSVEDEDVTVSPKQEATITLEQLLAIQGKLPLRNTDDLPVETRVIRSPYYEQTGYEQTAQHQYWQARTQPSQYSTVPNLDEYRQVEQIPTQVPVMSQQPVQRLSPAKTTLEQRAAMKVGEAIRYWNAGHNSVRKLQAASGWSDGFTRAVIRIMENQGIIERDR